MKLNCIAVDDEPLALDQMKEYINKVPFLNLVGLFKNGIDVIDFLRSNKVDLMFLDVEMDDLNGIQLLESIAEKPKVILTTAFDEYAIKGYELDVRDYLLKPISFERFIKSVNKIYTDFSKPIEKQIEKTNDNFNDVNFIFVKSDYKMKKVDFDEIQYIESIKDYLKIHTKDEKIITNMSMKSIELLLPKNNFIRIHKSFLIAFNKISSIGKNIISINNKNIPIGDFYKKDFFDYIALHTKIN
ncbi:MAG: response regulator transcription factor [Salinivirgaceae bacterium]|nr:response regulator transcription factor [Salinivirgaceae bacterium]